VDWVSKRTGVRDFAEIAPESGSSPYGTFDQGGNVFEWNEAISGSSRGLPGGSFIRDDRCGRSLPNPREGAARSQPQRSGWLHRRHYREKAADPTARQTEQTSHHEGTVAEPARRARSQVRSRSSIETSVLTTSAQPSAVTRAELGQSSASASRTIGTAAST
jgi:hypothetical protein